MSVKHQIEQSAPEPQQPEIDGFRAQHLVLGEREVATEAGRTKVVVDENESPLAWLARRRGRDGRVMIEPHQLQAGERLRAEFTRAHLMPRTTSNWSNPIPSNRRSGGHQASFLPDSVIAARQRVHHALDAVGPEFSGLLVDVCCFLKRLEVAESERGWPARSAKIVLQLALERPDITAMPQVQAAAFARGCALGLLMTWRSALTDCGYATAAKAAPASVRIRCTIERKPFER